jgi:hypothetical protein
MKNVLDREPIRRIKLFSADDDRARLFKELQEEAIEVRITLQKLLRLKGNREHAELYLEGMLRVFLQSYHHLWLLMDAHNDVRKDEALCRLMEFEAMWEEIRAKARASVAKDRRAELRLVENKP